MDMFCLYYTMNTPGGSNFEKYGIHNMISFITIYFFIFKSTLNKIVIVQGVVIKKSRQRAWSML